jgi:crotonobetainyl-CoA:carnitine CoA-transferase CaiB-like acyl-CoA transferase
MDVSKYAELFLTEGREHLGTCNQLLLEWERDPAGAAGHVAGLFRSIHTLKGMAGTMGYANLADLAHRGENLLDGGAPFYDTYRTSDGGRMAVGALEPPFYAALLDGLGLDLPPTTQYDRDTWPSLRARFTACFASRTRDEWTEIFAGTDACVAPVLAPREAPAHPHNRARNAFVEVDGVPQPAPAPRFARTPPPAPQPPTATIVDDVLTGWSG